MKETSQRYLNSEAHGYLMEAKAYKLLIKDLLYWGLQLSV